MIIQRKKLTILLLILLLPLYCLVGGSIAGRVNVMFTNFTAGEFSSRLDGRVDLAKYYNACQTLENMVIWPHGGVSRRPGMHYVADASYSNAKCRLIPFQFSTTQAYVLEFGDQYMRGYMNQGQLQIPDAYTKLLIHCDGNDGSTTFTDEASPHTITANGNAQVDTAYKKFGTGALLSDGTGDYLSVPDHADWFMDTGTFTIDMWMRFNVAPSAPTSADFAYQEVDDNNYVKFYYLDNYLRLLIKSGGDTKVAMYATWYPAADTWYHIALIRGWGGNANDWAITIGGSVRDVETDADSWPDLAASLIIGHFDGWTDEPRVSKGIARWTANFAPPLSEYPGGDNSGTPYQIATPYVEEHLPQLQFVQSADTMWIVHPEYEVRKLTRTAHTTWTLTAYAPTSNPFSSDAGTMCPGSVAFFEERLWFANTDASPQTILSTVSGDFEDMSAGTSDASAVIITIAADQVNVIRWLVPTDSLVVGTVGGEWIVSSAGPDDPITPTNIKVIRQTTHGSANIQAIQVSHSVLFVQRAKRKVRELAYNFEIDGYTAPDMTLLAEHITKGGIEAMAYQQEPDGIIWFVRSDGVLLGMTYMRAQDVIGWHRHITEGCVESVAVIPAEDADELWLSVKREVDGGSGTDVPKRYIEYIDSTGFTDLEDAFFVDSGLTYDGASATTITGLTHLATKTVAILADGVIQATQTVSAAGRITISSGASVVQAGLPYTSVLETMRIAAGDIIQGKIKRISRVIVRLFESLNLEIGPDSSNLDEISDSMAAVYTGDLELAFPSGYERAARVYVRQEDPLPLNVLAIMAQVGTADER